MSYSRGNRHYHNLIIMANSHILFDSSNSQELSKTNPTMAASPEEEYVNKLKKKCCHVIYGDLDHLPSKVRQFVKENSRICKPDTIHICDGSEHENNLLLYTLQRDGLIKSVPKYDNW